MKDIGKGRIQFTKLNFLQKQLKKRVVNKIVRTKLTLNIASIDLIEEALLSNGDRSRSRTLIQSGEAIYIVQASYKDLLEKLSPNRIGFKIYGTKPR